jgi:hypothetical protein
MENLNLIVAQIVTVAGVALVGMLSLSWLRARRRQVVEVRVADQRHAALVRARQHHLAVAFEGRPRPQRMQLPIAGGAEAMAASSALRRQSAARGNQSIAA